MALRKEFPYFSNARTVRNAMERARRIAATRILTDALDNGTKYTMDQIQSFKASDFQVRVVHVKSILRQCCIHVKSIAIRSSGRNYFNGVLVIKS